MEEILKKYNVDYKIIDGEFYNLTNQNIIFYVYNLDTILDRSFLYKKSLYFKNELNKRLIVIYEDEIFNKRPLIENKIVHLLKLSKVKRIHINRCEIREISKEDKNNFLNLYHIQGTDRSNILIGGFYKNELVTVMTFDNNRNMNSGNDDKDTHELTRFATHNDYIILDAGSTLIKYFISNFNPTKIISFADRRWSDDKNNMYFKLGFKQTKHIKPDYYYTNNIEVKRFHKVGFGKSSILKKFPSVFDKNKTEYEMMSELGYHQIWDIGKLRFELFFDENNVPQSHFGIVYKITNLVNGKIYIGQTTRTLGQRRSEYYKPNPKANDYVKNSIQKYGKENFSFETIDYAQNIDELNDKEIYWIRFYSSTNKEKGYNQHDGGRNSLLSEETREKISIGNKGKSKKWVFRTIFPGTPEAKAAFARPITDEQKEYLSDISRGENGYWFGKERDKETGDKIRKTKLEQGKAFQVCRFDMEKHEVLDIWDSVEYGAKMTGVSPSTIKRHCTFQIKIYETAITWRYYKELSEQLAAGIQQENLFEKTKSYKRVIDHEHMKATRGNRKKVKVTNLDTLEEVIYPSTTDCGVAFNLSDVMISHYCKGKYTPKINFRFEFNNGI